MTTEIEELRECLDLLWGILEPSQVDEVDGVPGRCGDLPAEPRADQPLPTMKRPDRVLDAAGAPTAEFLEWSRAELQVADDWVWYWCENGCGEIVWCPPGLPTAVVKACSTRCVIEVTRKIGGA